MKIATKVKPRWKYIIPVAIFSSLAPLIVRLKVVSLNNEASMFLGGANNIMSDFFAYYKMVFIAFSFVLAILVYIVNNDWKKDLKRDKINYGIYVYLLTVVLSLLLSSYKSIAFMGVPGRHEGTIVLTAYAFMLFFIMYTIDGRQEIDSILKILFFSSLIICTIGLFQYIGYDFFQTSFGKKLMLPASQRSIAEGLKFNFGKYAIYSTLYNTNYMGSYSVLLLPVIITQLYVEKKKPLKLFYGVLLLVVAFNWFGCNSRAGYLGGLIALIILIMGFKKEIFRNWKRTTLVILLLILVFSTLDKFSEGKIKNRFLYLKEDVKKVFSEDAETSEVLDIKINGNKLIFRYAEDALTIVGDAEGIIFYNEEGNPILADYNTETADLMLEDEKYKSFGIKFFNNGEKNILQLNRGWKFNFYVSDTGFEILDAKGNPIELKDPPHIGFEGKENLGSSRGYIYSRSLPLLKDTILIGHGADTYIFYFPQDDIVGKANYMANPYIVVDKPHNMYIQMAINTGIVSLIAFLAMIVIYTIRTIKALKKFKEYGYYEFMSVAILASVWGYLVAGLFNDSVVSVAPVFWTLWGLGMAINMRMKKATV